MPKNIRIMHTQITDKIRISTAGIWYLRAYSSGYLQYETLCFSSDKRQRFFQVIHGICAGIDTDYLTKSIKIHRQISANLKDRFKED